jgi:parallel beta-helix repeat protein
MTTIRPMTMTRPSHVMCITRRRTAFALTLPLSLALVGVGGCDSDDDDATTTSAGATDGTDTTTGTTGGTESTTGTDTTGSGTGTTGTGTDTGEPGCAPAAGCDLMVCPSADDDTAVQTAFIDVPEGGTVCLSAGTFNFTQEMSLAVDGVTVRGASAAETILSFADQAFGANGIAITGNDVTIRDLTVLDTPGDGIRATAVQNITFLDMVAGWTTPKSETNGAYGLYPVKCDGVVMDGVEVYGARDAGIYVGQSQNILVQNSKAHGNVAGIEIENSIDAVVRYNEAYDNTGGVLIFDLPGLELKNGQRTLVHNNRIYRNNEANWGIPGTSVGKIPRGTGVIVLCADFTELRENDIRDNSSYGIAVVSYLDLLFGGFDDPEFDQFPEGTYIHDNTIEGNGGQQDPFVALILRGDPGSVIWDGCRPEMARDPNRDDPCLSNNVTDAGGAISFINGDLCNNSQNRELGLDNYTCEYEAFVDPWPESSGN